MRNVFFTFVLVLLFQLVFSQKKSDKINWRVNVVDSTNSIGIGGATVSIINKIKLITNSNGRAEINKVITGKDDSIKVSCIGYKTLQLKLDGKYPDTLRLSSSISILKEVTINASNKGNLLGNVQISYKGGYLPGPDQEIAEYLPNDQKIVGTISKVVFALLDGHKGIGKPFMVHLYIKKKESIYPQQDMLKDSIVVYNPKRTAIVSIDLSKYNIQMPEDGFFVSFQTMSPGWYGKEMITLNGHDFFRVPGIKGVFKDGRFNFDEEERAGAGYALIRNINESSDWRKFEYGTDFAIGALVYPQ